MFSVIFETLPVKENWHDYLDSAERLRPELEQVEGFVDNIRYRSLTREGWILSLSNWRDEKSLVRWRTRGRHHEAQQKGRDEILADYHLRVGQITADNQVPAGYALTEQRLDETEVGEGTTVTLINATRPAEWQQTDNPYDCAEWLGLNPWAADSTSWDIFDAVLRPGDLILLASWKDAAAAQAYEEASAPNDNARIRRVRIVRDYGKYDRREAPQCYANAKDGEPPSPDTGLSKHERESATMNSKDDGARRPQAVVAGDLDGLGALTGRAGASTFSIGGPDGRGGTAAGANPYELLSASLAACTAMTIRLQARRRKFPLSHVEVAVSYHHGGDGGRDSFDRSITLEGNLGDEERAQLMQAANMCPVGRTLGLNADIRTNDNVSAGRAASYDDDLSELPIPNIDPD